MKRFEAVLFVFCNYNNDGPCFGHKTHFLHAQNCVQCTQKLSAHYRAPCVLYMHFKESVEASDYRTKSRAHGAGAEQMPLVRPSRFRVIRRRAAVPDEMRGQHSQEMPSEDGLSTKFFELPLPRPEHRLESPRYKLPPRPAITGTGKPSRIPCEALAAISALRNATIKIKTIPT